MEDCLAAESTGTLDTAKAFIGISRSSSRRHEGQALVEFALVLPFLLLVIFGTIEVSRMMSLYLTIQDIARRGAMYGSLSDPTLSRRPSQVALKVFELLKKEPTIRYSINKQWKDQPPGDNIKVDVNHQKDGAYCTKVSLRLTMNFLLLPGIGKKNHGFIPISSTAVLINETQGKRRNADKIYEEERFQIIELAKGNVEKELERELQ